MGDAPPCPRPSGIAAAPLPRSKRGGKARRAGERGKMEREMEREGDGEGERETQRERQRQRWRESVRRVRREVQAPDLAIGTGHRREET